MASVKTLMIQALRAAVIAIPNFGTFRGWNGQFLDNKQNPIKYPCALWELSEINWQTMKHPDGIGTIQQDLRAQIILHVGVRSFGIEPHIDDEVFEIADSVAAAVVSVDEDEFGNFKRLNETQDVDHNQVVDHQITFEFGIIDCKTFVDEYTVGIIKTLQEHGDIQPPPPDATTNFGKIPQYGTDDPAD